MMKPMVKSPSTESSSPTTTTSSETTDDSDNNEVQSIESDEDDDDEFVDAPEASGTLISKYLDPSRLSTIAQSIYNREDLTKQANWGGSPSNLSLSDFETPPSKNTSGTSTVIVSSEGPSTSTSPKDSSSTSEAIDASGGNSGGSSKTTTLRTVSERVRQSKLDETRRRLIHGEDDDDDEDDEIRMADEEGRKLDPGDIPGTRSSHSSTSPSQASTCSDGASLSKQSTTTLTVQPFKVVEEQDNISLGRHSQYHAAPVRPSSSQVSVPSADGLQVGRPPDIVSSCCTDTIVSVAVAKSVPASDPINSATNVVADAGNFETPFNSEPPIPPPRRKKKKNVTAAEEPRSKSPTVSIRSHVMTDTRHNINMYAVPTSSISSANMGGMLVVTAQDEEKTRAKGSGPKVLRRTESLGLVQSSPSNPSSASNSLEKDKPEQNVKENEESKTIPPPQPQIPNPAKPSSVRNRVPGQGKGPGRRKSSSLRMPPIPGSYSLPGPSLSNVSAEIKKHSLPILRSKTDGGKVLSDLEILEQVTVLNLDTGERIPLSSAEDKIPKCVNPLTLHIMRLTSEYVSEDKSVLDSDDDDNSSRVSTTTSEGLKRKRLQLKKYIGNVGRSALSKAKSFKAAASSKFTSKSLDEGETEASSSLPLPQPNLFPIQHHASSQPPTRQQLPPSSLKFNSSNYLAPPVSADAASVITTSSGATLENGPPILKMKASPKHKGPYDFENLELVQELTRRPPDVTTAGSLDAGLVTPSTPNSSLGPIWCMKFSNCGRLLAAAGQEKLIKVFVLKSQLNYFVDLIKTSKVSPTPSVESMNHSGEQASGSGFGDIGSDGDGENLWPFVPLSSYAGHTADLLDIAWSKSFFLLSSSMDRTVRLWHISRKECLCTFQHVDFVTAIAFHPRDDRYFLSGSLDSKVRIWNIPDKKVALWNEVPGPNNLITTANFCQNGKFAVVGTYDGRVIFYHTEQLKYHTQIILNKKKCVKISGIEPMPGEDKILVTSNDSRIRLFDLRDLSLNCKYTGSVTRSSQIKASFSHDGKFIISGSENNFIYLWRTAHEYVGFRGGARRDRNKYWEGVRVHTAVVTCAIFAPDPDLIIKEMLLSGAGSAANKTGTATSTERNNYSQLGYVIASADFMGQIKIFICRIKPKCSSLPVSAIA